MIDRIIYQQKVIDFAWLKEKVLNDSLIASPPTIDELITRAEELNLPASKAQLELYRDHYYGEQK
jgi:hypothetical protein